MYLHIFYNIYIKEHICIEVGKASLKFYKHKVLFLQIFFIKKIIYIVRRAF